MPTKKSYQQKNFVQDLLDDLSKSTPNAALGLASELLDPQDTVTYADWIKTELPDMFSKPYGPHQRWILDQMQMQQDSLRMWVAASRGSGKSSLIAVAIPLAAIAMGHHSFIVIICASQTHAEARLDAIRSILDSNPDIARKWPKLQYVKRSSTSSKNKVDTRKEIQLIGGTIVAVGAGASIRGIVRISSDGKDMIRPSLAIIDDLDTLEQARSKLRTDRVEDWIFSDVAGLGKSGEQFSIIGLGTTVASDAICTRAINNKGRFASWETKKFPAEYKDENGARRASWPQGLPIQYLYTLTDKSSVNYIGDLAYSREYLLDPINIDGATWTEDMISFMRHEGDLPAMTRIIVGVDPSWGTMGDECGILVGGVSQDRTLYVLADYSVKAAPQEWGREVRRAYMDWNCQKALIEKAFGDEQIKMVMNSVASDIPYGTIPASRGSKQERFEPLALLSNQGKIKLNGYFEDLETTLLTWTPDSHWSPDRIDALAVLAQHLIMGRSAVPASISSPKPRVLSKQGAASRHVSR